MKLARENSDTIEEIEEEVRRNLIIEKCRINKMNGIIDKELMEIRNKLVHSSNPVISAYISPELFTIIDSLRGDMSRSAFCRMAISEYCSAIQEMGCNSSSSKNSRNEKKLIKKSKKQEVIKEKQEN